MGTAKTTFFLQCFILKNMFKKSNKFIHELVHHREKWARQMFQCIFVTLAILPDCPGKRTAKKYNIYICNTTSMQHFL